MNEQDETNVKKIYECIIFGLNCPDKQVYEYDIQFINQESKEIFEIVENNYLLLNKLIIKKFYSYCREYLLKLNRNSKDYNEIEFDSLSLCILLINPNFTTAWSTRKKLIYSSRDNNNFESIVNKEFYINDLILKRNFKCEQAYQHRRWLIKLNFKKIEKHKNDMSINDQSLKEFLTGEIKLILNLSNKLKQNYYCWTYLNWLLSTFFDLDLIQDFLNKKHLIYENPSDFSVLHSRLHLLNLLIENRSDIKQIYDIFISELELFDDLIIRYSQYTTIWNYRKYFLLIMYKNINNKIQTDSLLNDLKELNLKLIDISRAVFSKIYFNEETFHYLDIKKEPNIVDIVVSREQDLVKIINFLHDSNQSEKKNLVVDYSKKYVNFIQKFIS